METVKKNVGLIEFDPNGKKTQIGENLGVARQTLKKVFTAGNPDNVKLHYPEAEVVNDTHSIIQDNSIELIIISSGERRDLEFIGDALKSGKNLLMI
ncbi:MAG: hypothetical protein J0H74_12245 [Chitinophagaceae bacterium]|nr:hypothetical protein [Chitinophagaceae bacterium]